MRVSIVVLPSPVLAEPWSNFPLGAGYVAAAVEDRCDVSILDFSDKDIEVEDIPEADIYGLSVATPQYYYAKKLAVRIKERFPRSIIVAGGPHLLVSAKDFSEDENIDSVVIGEGELSFQELVDSANESGKVKPVYSDLRPDELDQLRFPARHLYPDFKEKATQIHQLMKGDYCKGGQTTIIASRGCPYACSFCAPHERTMRFRSPENTVAEIRDTIDRFGVYQYKWQDDTFSVNKDWVLHLCKLIRTKLPKTYHRAHTRVNVFDDEMGHEMYRAGFRVVCFGIESMSQRILDLNSKATKIEQIEQALQTAKRHSLRTVGFFLFGMPGEDPDTIQETKEGIYRNIKNLDYINMATLVPLVGTPLWNDPDKYGCEILDRNYEKLWIVGHDDNDDILVRTKGVSLETMIDMKRDIYAFLKELHYDRPEWRQAEQVALTPAVCVR